MTQPQPRPQPQPREASWPRTLVSPSGMVLALLCLFLPFVGVSCETGLGELRVQASGWDLAVNGQPSVSGSSMSADDLGELPGASSWSPGQGAGAHALMLLGVLALLTGLVLGTLLRSTRVRALSGISTAGAAAALFAANEVVVLVQLNDRIDEHASWVGDDIAGGTRFGFWVTLSLLAAIVGYHLIELLLERRPANGPVPGHGPPPGHGPNPPPWPPTHQQPHPYPGPPGPPGPSGPPQPGQPRLAPPQPGPPPGSPGGWGTPNTPYGPRGPHDPNGPFPR